MTGRHLVGSLAPIVIVLTLLGVTSLSLAAPPQTSPKQDQSRSWLRPTSASRTSPSRTPSSWTWGKITASIVLVGLGGYALYRRRRGVKIPGTRQTLGELSVVAATRLGPKSQVVLVRVGSRLLLVGATDTSVNSLGWLDDGTPSEPLGEQEREPSYDESPDEDQAPPASQSASPNARLARTSRFREVLADAIGLGVPARPQPVRRAIPRTSPAELLAERTTDRFTRTTAAPSTSRRRSATNEPSLLDVEGQARGLVSRLERKVP